MHLDTCRGFSDYMYVVEHWLHVGSYTMRMRKLNVHVRQYLFVLSAYPRLFDSRWVSCIALHRPVAVSFEQTRIPSTKICDCCWYYTGISRDSWHKRRATGGKKTPLRKKRKFELGRAAANTKVHNDLWSVSISCVSVYGRALPTRILSRY